MKTEDVIHSFRILIKLKFHKIIRKEGKRKNIIRIKIRILKLRKTFENYQFLMITQSFKRLQILPPLYLFSAYTNISF